MPPLALEERQESCEPIAMPLYDSFLFNSNAAERTEQEGTADGRTYPDQLTSSKKPPNTPNGVVPDGKYAEDTWDANNERVN